MAEEGQPSRDGSGLDARLCARAGRRGMVGVCHHFDCECRARAAARANRPIARLAGRV